ncbi:hypothetical protein DB30_07451 [Enhygromyxa salina]|uniref:Uncharacterized protein n=1 Tax=Enhygromyxa salina TaxID=215803 RepID=A0A0C1ZS47_9BACT|nr:hypothetical protein DB30_07451 [Enhygromyxa salina]
MLEIDPAYTITRTEPIAVLVEVVELGPLDPARVYLPSPGRIVEALPGDRVRMEIVVVDVDGVPLPEDTLDSLWIQCGDSPCTGAAFASDEPGFDLDCAELEAWTTDSVCRLGEGQGSFEFTVPELGESMFAHRHIKEVSAVVAWDGERAERCWTGRREGGAVSPNCGFVRFAIDLGPVWFLTLYAESLGFATAIPPSLFPAPVFEQQANREPMLTQLEIQLNDEPQAPLPISASGQLGPIEVQPGDSIELQIIPDEIAQFGQASFLPFDYVGNAFALRPEKLRVRISTTGVLEYPGGEDESRPRPLEAPFLLRIPSAAEPGTVRAILVVVDDRGAERLVSVEFEIQ